jgi:hypothetical protein
MAQTINIQRLWDQKYRDESVPFPIDGSAGAAQVIDVADKGAKGDGTTNDTTALQAAINAAQVIGGTAYSAAGKTYKITATLTVTAACTLDFSRSTIIKANGFSGDPHGAALTITGSNVIVKNLVQDGNRLNNQTTFQAGIWVDTGTNNYFEAVTAQNNWWVGFTHNSGDNCTFNRCNAIGNAGTGGSDGFRMNHFVGGVLLNCFASSNDRAGCAIEGSGVRVEYFSTTLNNWGILIHGNRNYVANFFSVDDNQWGLHLNNESAVQFQEAAFNRIESAFIDFTGNTADNPAGTGCQLAGASLNSIGILRVSRQTGYGLAVTRNDTNPSVGSDHNDFASVSVDPDPNFGGDPGIHFSGGSNYNSIGVARVNGASVALIIGEDTLPVPTPTNPLVNVNSHNYVGTLYAENCGFGGVSINCGQYNHIGELISRNCFDTDLSLEHGIVGFYPDRFGGVGLAGRTPDTSWVTENTIGFVDHRTDAGITKPSHIVFASTNATNNTVYAMNNRGDFATAETSISGTGNALGKLRGQHMAAATPTGGSSGEVRVGNGKIWVNDAGTWKSATVT